MDERSFVDWLNIIAGLGIGIGIIAGVVRRFRRRT